MKRRYNVTHLILVVVIVLDLTPLIVGAAPQAQIVFSSNRDGNWEIYVMDADGKNLRRLTKNPHDEWEPSWSPDGKRIAFASEGVGNFDIYVMNADGARQVRRLTKNRSGDAILHGLTRLFRFLPPAKGLQCGVGSNRLTDNCLY